MDARAAFRRARIVSAEARGRGCGLDEADERLQARWSRRRFLAGAGATAAAALVPGIRPPAAGPTARSGPTPGRVVIVGAGIAGLGCAYRLWSHAGVRADVFEYDAVAGGRIQTLRGYFDDGQIAEKHAEFINPEHTETLKLAASFGLSLDNTDRYPPGTHAGRETMRFGGRAWPQSALNAEWHDWAWSLFHRAAFEEAPWPTLYDRSSAGGQRFDHMSVVDWIDTYVPGGVGSDFGALCIAAVLDEFGGPPEEQSALNLVYLLGQDASIPGGAQPRDRPALGGADEKWHVHGGNDQLITGLLDRLPAGTVHLEHRLVALRPRGVGRYTCTFEAGGATREVTADHVVLALPFPTLRQVDTAALDIAPLHRRAIEQEPLGTNSKMFVQCSPRVWDLAHDTGNTYCDGVVQSGWDATGYQPGTAGILVALPGGTLGAEWGARFGLVADEGPAPGSLLGPYVRAFDQLFPGVADAYNGKSYYVWSPGDPHILGAYSYLKVGQYTAFNGIQGQREGNVHFAGEHTSVNFQGYVEGALRSGYRCAAEITS